MRTPPGRISSPGSISSSPLVSTATRGRRRQATTAAPSEASTPSSAGPIAGARSPARSRPVGCRRRRGGCRGPAPPRSAPRPDRPRRACPRPGPRRRRRPGATAPVEIGIASPGRSSAAAGCPARDSPTIRRATGASGRAPRGVGRAHREAVHGGVVEARHGLGGDERPPPGACRAPRAAAPARRRAAPRAPGRAARACSTSIGSGAVTASPRRSRLDQASPDRASGGRLTAMSDPAAADEGPGRRSARSWPAGGAAGSAERRRWSSWPAVP